MNTATNEVVLPSYLACSNVLIPVFIGGVCYNFANLVDSDEAAFRAMIEQACEDQNLKGAINLEVDEHHFHIGHSFGRSRGCLWAA